MSTLESIISKIDELDDKELLLLSNKVNSKIKRRDKAKEIIENFTGKADGLWSQTEPQEYIDHLRKDRVIKNCT